jgi:hypothetical protein
VRFEVLTAVKMTMWTCNVSEKQTVSIFGAEESVPIQEKTHRREFRKALQQRRSKLDSVCSVKKYSVCNENTSFESGL